MRLTRIFQPGNYQPGQTLSLNSSAAHHLATVLRCKPGDKISMFSGDGYDYPSSITSVSKKNLTVTIEDKQKNQFESPLNIHLAQAICKGDKMDWIIQKATELGVSAITPITSSRSTTLPNDKARQEKKLKHWEGVIQHACEQSGRARLPQLQEPCTFEHFLEYAPEGEKVILSPHDASSLKQTPLASNTVTILIGPEGGWSEIELSSSRMRGFRAVSLGPRTLRAETASIAVISALQYVVGDF